MANTTYLDSLCVKWEQTTSILLDMIPWLYGPYRVVRKWKGRTFVVWRGK